MAIRQDFFLIDILCSSLFISIVYFTGRRTAQDEFSHKVLFGLQEYTLRNEIEDTSTESYFGWWTSIPNVPALSFKLYNITY